MSLISTFVDAFKKASSKPTKPQADKELLRSQGGSLGSTNTFRPAPEPDTGQGSDPGRGSVAGEPDAGASGQSV